MKNHLLFWLLIILVGLVISGGTSQNASANSRELYQGHRQSARDQLAAQTPIPTDSPSIALTATAESRVLPPVGSNAGLVIGASVLVLIIIGGVLGSQWKKKH
jgi:hypothetical protein